MRLLLVALCPVLLAGCGGDTGSTVEGKVKISDGSTAARGSVTLTSETGTFTGGIESDGTFKIENVAAGTYKVALNGVKDGDPPTGDGMNYDADGNYIESKEPEPKSLIKAEYSDPTKSGLSLTVPSDSYEITADAAG